MHSFSQQLAQHPHPFIKATNEVISRLQSSKTLAPEYTNDVFV